MANAALEASKENGAHARLARLAGDWAGSTRVWFEPGKLADESPSRGRIRMALDGRVAVHEYSGSCLGKPQEGIALIAYHLDESRYEMAWVDSFHMGSAIMFAVGSEGAISGSVLGSYFAGPGAPRWGWRTQIEELDADHLRITAYNIPPGEAEGLAVETLYARQT